MYEDRASGEAGPTDQRMIRAAVHAALTACELAIQCADRKAAQQREVEPCLRYTRASVALGDAMTALHRCDALISVTLLAEVRGGDRGSDV